MIFSQEINHQMTNSNQIKKQIKTAFSIARGMSTKESDIEIN